jgi:hypothetical protein
MTSLALVVGQRRTVLVATALLIVACSAQSETPRPPDGAVTTADEIDAAADASALVPVDVVVAPDANVGPPASDAHAEAPRATAWDAAAADAARDVAADATPVSGGGAPAPWLDLDVGMVTAKGDTTATASAFTVVAGGAGIGATADSFHFVYQPWTGDGEIVARVANVGATYPDSQAGVMFRATLDAEAANVTFALPGGGATSARLQSRSSAGGPTVPVPGDRPVTATPQYLRLVRAGQTFSAYRSSDRASWAPAGSVEVAMPATVYVGLATAGHGAGTATAIYNYVTIDNLSAVPPPAAWEALDVGTLGASTAWSGDALALTGFGAPFTASMDYFSGVVRSATGSQRLTIRVDAQSSTDPQAQVGLMFREGLASTTARSSAFALVSVSPTRGIQFASRAMRAGMTMTGARQMAVGPPVWLRLDRREAGATSEIVAAYSLDGNAWTTLDSCGFDVAGPLVAGAIAAAGSDGGKNSAALANLTLVTLADEPTDAGAPVGAPDAGVADAAVPNDVAGGADAGDTD